jgi:hypothetical protein
VCSDLLNNVYPFASVLETVLTRLRHRTSCSGQSVRCIQPEDKTSLASPAENTFTCVERPQSADSSSSDAQLTHRLEGSNVQYLLPTGTGPDVIKHIQSRSSAWHGMTSALAGPSHLWTMLVVSRESFRSDSNSLAKSLKLACS